jgi:hypothetical protein
VTSFSDTCFYGRVNLQDCYICKIDITLSRAGKKECEEAINKLPVLSSRKWKTIKFAVKDIIASENKLAL